MAAPCVFITYSHRDATWKDRFVAALQRVDTSLLFEVWHDGKIDEGSEWYDEINNAIDRASIGVLLVSENFLQSDFCMREELPALLARARERGMLMVPVLLEPCNWMNYHWLRSLQQSPHDAEAIASGEREREEAALEVVAKSISKWAEKPPRTLKKAPGRRQITPVNTSHLLKTGVRLIGRQGDLLMLDLAWRAFQTNVVCIDSPGGAGKTTLVNEWLGRLLENTNNGVHRVFGWTFLGKGSTRGFEFADDFFDEAIPFFSNGEMGTIAPWDRGSTLARLVSADKNLLILDGLEIMQSPLEDERGTIRDPELSAFLVELAESNKGLCVITTREPVSDFQPFGNSVAFQKLEFLTPDVGRVLLRLGGASGNDRQLEEAVMEVKGHSLALALLVALLKLREDRELPMLDQPDVGKAGDESTAQPWRVLRAIENELGDNAELELLRLLALFDRPAESPAVDALLQQPSIPGLTDALSALDKRGLRRLIASMRQFGLLTPEASGDSTALDYHPIVREYFRRQLDLRAAAGRAGHARLFAYYGNAAPQKPSTRTQMAPLYHAVVHGCRAGKLQEALDEVFWRRIQRGQTSYNVQILGAYGADLTMCSEFFDRDWNVLPALKGGDVDYVLNCVGFDLTAMGRIREAQRQMRAAQQAACKLGRWREAALSGTNLADCLTLEGRLDEATEVALEAVSLAERSRDWEMRWLSHATLGHTLHNVGRLTDAHQRFQQAEQIQLNASGQAPVLQSIPGFHYCELLIALGHRDEAFGRASVLVEFDRRKGWWLELGLHHLNLASSHLASGDLSMAEACAAEAVEELQRLTAFHHISRGLLLRGRIRARRGKHRDARMDLLRALRISRTRGYRLYELLALLEDAKQYQIEPDPARALKKLVMARPLAEEFDYRGARAEITDLEGTLQTLL